ncbi:MAG: UDP-3-O-(3-hydroxymyristoyl)glucosamine N-acyltransferase, partial [Pseudomonadota bacterium]
VQIGKHSVVVAQVGIAGSSHIGNGVMLGGQVGVVGHVKVGDNVKVAAQSGVMGDLSGGASYGGSPAVPIKDWHRQTLALSKSVKRKETENE